MRIDIKGKRFGHLVVLGPAESLPQSGAMYWKCRCDCGNEKSIRGSHLRSGKILSCGCLKKTACLTHGQSYTPEYKAWVAMKGRCTNKNNAEYHNYGGRGIRVCARWATFENFFADMGRRPTAVHSIDRRDNQGNYTPNNCRWATDLTQSNNQRNNRRLTLNGKTHTAAEWSRLLGLNVNTIRVRLHRGYSDAQALQGIP